LQKDREGKIPFDYLEKRQADYETTTDTIQEARNTPFCPPQEKFHTVILRGVRNIYQIFLRPRKIPL
jgi:hypothetical protein